MVSRQRIAPWGIVIFAVGVFLFLCRQASGETAVFASQGQAVYDTQDLAKSQQEAIGDLLVQAVAQALDVYVDPSEMNTKYAAQREKILKQPERYVQTYQIFSENSSEDLYRIAGQVTVSLDVLKRDLGKLGVAVTRARLPEPPPAAPESPSDIPTPPSPEETETATAPEPEEEERVLEGAGPVSEPRVLWAVAEKWNSDWILPFDSQRNDALFALSVLQESHDFGWSIRFPEAGSISVDERGDISRESAASVARSLDMDKVIIGSVVFRYGGGGAPSLDCSLRIIDAASGGIEGNLEKKLLVEEGFYLEGAMELAAAMTPQLDRILTAPVRTGASTYSVSKSADAGSRGEVTLLIRSDRQLAHWKEMEKKLKERFRSLAVQSMELTPEGIKVNVRGVGGDLVNVLEGMQLSRDAHVQVGIYSPQTNSLEVTVLSQ